MLILNHLPSLDRMGKNNLMILSHNTSDPKSTLFTVIKDDSEDSLYKVAIFLVTIVFINTT
jgi:hypothetical protein